MTISIFQIILAFCIGLIVVTYGIPVIVRISIAKRLYDVPGERKVNKTVIPNLGGIALFAGISIGTLIGILRDSFPDWRYISSGMIILFFIGIKDDILVISARKKLAAQVICALILILLGDIRISHFQGILGIHEINYWVSVIFSSILIIGTINAMNLIDGIDGLASAIGIMATLIFGSLFYILGNFNYAILCFATAGSLVSFYLYNVHGKTNKIFMGDTGSLILGLIIAVSAINYIETAISGMYTANYSPILTLAILSVPLFDMIRLFALRIIQKKSPFSPDMNHIHHMLLKLGLSHRSVRRIILITNLAIIGIIYPLRTINNNLLLCLLLFMITLLMALPAFIYEFIKSENSIATRIWFKPYFIALRTLFYGKTNTTKNTGSMEENYLEKPLKISKVQRNFQPAANVLIKNYMTEKKSNDNLVS